MQARDSRRERVRGNAGMRCVATPLALPTSVEIPRDATAVGELERLLGQHHGAARHQRMDEIGVRLAFRSLFGGAMSK